MSGINFFQKLSLTCLLALTFASHLGWSASDSENRDDKIEGQEVAVLGCVLDLAKSSN